MDSINRGDGVVQSEGPSMSLLQGASGFSIQNSKFYQIYGDATIIHFGDDQFTQDQRDWIRDIISTNAALPKAHDNLIRKFLTQLIINIPRAEAMFNDYQNKKKGGPCLEGTRVVLLREMAYWVTDLDGSRMFVLSGLAGIGKSTVAYTIASRAAELNLLGASFFFSRDEPDRNNAKKFFTTIAYQLCVFNEVCAKAIGDTLQTERGSDAMTKDPQEQLQVLIINPLRSIIQSRTRPILVVVDALDECDEEEQYAIFAGLNQLVRDLPPFKVILTTRPTSYLDFGQDGQNLLHLQDIEDKIVDSDIRVYLEHSLSLEQVQKRFPKKRWCASDEEIDSLVGATGRLFIIASTAVRYILDKTASNPAGQMRKLLRTLAEDRTSFKDLDRFYNVILRNVVPANCDDNDIVSRYQSVVGAIVFVQQPLPISALTHLIDIDEDDIDAVLDHLQSVILLSDDNIPRIYHRSFPDYITDEARCKDIRLRIDPKVHHMQIASHCFEIANTLKYNILGLGKTARYMANTDSLKEDGITDEKLREKIPEQLRYACVYLANHLQVENIDLMNGLEKFVNKHTLHWFEVLSLIGNLDVASRALRAFMSLLDLTSSEVYQLLSDALRFISNFYEVIEQSALHTYYSALPLSPTDSFLYRQFIKEAEDKIFVIEGGPEKWDALVANPIHGVDVDFIKFSSNSELFFSCFEESRHGTIIEGKLRIWDAATGTPISTIPGQRFAISNDFSTIASSRDNVITYYNMNGSKTGTMLTTSSNVDRIALSDSGRIAAALPDGTVWLWQTKDAELIFDEFEGSKYRLRLQFSSTGTRLAYSSEYGSVLKLRDGMTGQFIADLQCGSEHKFVFSGDGYRIASLSSERGLTLWNSESGALISDVRNVGSNAIAISDNGSLLATADRDNITLWSENHGDLVQIVVLECRDACSMAFSPNNLLAFLNMGDIKLYNIKTNSFPLTRPYYGFSSVLAFSPDCIHLAYAEMGEMYLWDIRGIDTSGPPSNEAAAITTGIALSRDCSRIARGYNDGRVELWRTSPTMQRIVSYQGHSHRVTVMGFGPDGRLFASGSYDGSHGTVNLCNGGDGSLCGTLQVPHELKVVALSNSILVTGGTSNVTLWSLDKLSLIHTFQIRDEYKYLAPTVPISDEGDLVAIRSVTSDESVDLFDVKNRTIIASFEVPDLFYEWTFLPDKSHLVAKLFTTTTSRAFVSMDVINKCISAGPMFDHLIQLHNIPLWHGVPVWYSSAAHCVSALFSQDKIPVPVLRIPTNLDVVRWAEGSSMIVLVCTDGRIVVLRLPTSHRDDRISRPSKDGNLYECANTQCCDVVHYPSCADTRPKGAISNLPSASNALHSRNQQHEISDSQTADKRTLNPMSKLADKEYKEGQAKRVGHAMTKGLKTAFVSLTDRVTRKSKK